jgi:hypothetical protein
MTLIRGFLWAEEHMLLKIVATAFEAGMLLTHQLMNPLHKSSMDCCWNYTTVTALMSLTNPNLQHFLEGAEDLAVPK